MCATAAAMRKCAYLSQNLGFLSCLDFVEEAHHLHSEIWRQASDGTAAGKLCHSAQLLAVLLPIILQPQLNAL